MFGSNASVSIDHPTDRPNFAEVRIGPVDLYFSYRTVVAFRAPGFGQVVSENAWSQTTGKHLNWIDGGNKSGRLSHDEFERKLAELMAQLDVTFHETV